MKKFLIAILSFALIFSLTACGESNSTDETTSEANVETGITLYGAVILNGKLERSYDKFQAKDLDGDGFVQVIEALQQMNSEFFVIHDYETIDDYFTYETTDDGAKITKFFAQDGLDLAVYVNDAPIASLYDAVYDGDRIFVFNYTDTENHSDVYTFFTKLDSDGGNTTYQLMGWVKDENGEYQKVPIAGAEIPYDTDEGEVIYTTDSDGEVTLPCGDQDIVLVAEISAQVDEDGNVSSITYIDPIYKSAIIK